MPFLPGESARTEALALTHNRSVDRPGNAELNFAVPNRPAGATDRSHGWSEAQPVDPKHPFDPRPGGAKQTDANE